MLKRGTVIWELIFKSVNFFFIIVNPGNRIQLNGGKILIKIYSKRHVKNKDGDHRKYRKLCEDIIVRRTRAMEQGMEVIQDQEKFICLLFFTLR